MSQETIERLQARIDQLEQQGEPTGERDRATDEASGDATQTAAGRV